MTTMQISDLVFLGESGTTEVYAAVVGDSKTIALKKIKAAHQGNRRLRRDFPALAAAWSQHHHENLVRIYKVDAESVQVAMEKCESSLVDRFPDSPLEIWRILFDSLTAIYFLHSQNCLHLNIKPSNILRSADGRYKLSDGICPVVGAIDCTQAINPNYRFYAPEQLRLRSRLNVTSDLYALGMAVLDCLAGDQLTKFATKKMSTGSAVQSLWIEWLDRMDFANPTLEELNCSLHKKLDEFIEKLVCKNTVDRFASAGKALEALQAIRGVLGVPDGEREPAKPKNTKSNDQRDWSAGVELNVLSGTKTGHSFFNKTDFRVGGTRSCELPFNGDDYAGIGETAFVVSRDGAKWKFSGPSRRSFMINGRTTSGINEIQHGDVVRLGPEGPDLMVNRAETDAEKIIAMSTQIVARARKRRREEERHRQIEKATGQEPATDKPAAIPGKPTVSRTSSANEAQSESVAAEDDQADRRPAAAGSRSRLLWNVLIGTAVVVAVALAAVGFSYLFS